MSNLQAIFIRDFLMSRTSLFLDRINFLKVDWENNISHLEYEPEFLALKECIHVTKPIFVYRIDPDVKYLVVVHELQVKTPDSLRITFSGFIYERESGRSHNFLSIITEEEFEEVENEFFGYSLAEDLSIFFSRISGKLLPLERFTEELLKLHLTREVREIESFLGRALGH
ncbi:MAG: hypothetical protein QXY39_08900 [Thermofilaceae archaeon]